MVMDIWESDFLYVILDGYYFIGVMICYKNNFNVGVFFFGIEGFWSGKIMEVDCC